MHLSHNMFTDLLMSFDIDNQFADFFEALCFAITALASVGCGDMCPHNDLGRFIYMFSSLVEVAIIVLSYSVITASYLKIIKVLKTKKDGGC